jgi:hypothetical protein
VPGFYKRPNLTDVGVGGEGRLRVRPTGDQRAGSWVLAGLGVPVCVAWRAAPCNGSAPRGGGIPSGCTGCFDHATGGQRFRLRFATARQGSR